MFCYQIIANKIYIYFNKYNKYSHKIILNVIH